QPLVGPGERGDGRRRHHRAQRDRARDQAMVVLGDDAGIVTERREDGQAVEVRPQLLAAGDAGRREGRATGRTAVERGRRAIGVHLVGHPLVDVLAAEQAAERDRGGGRRERLDAAKIERRNGAVVGDVLTPTDDRALRVANEGPAIRHQVLIAVGDIAELECGHAEARHGRLPAQRDIGRVRQGGTGHAAVNGLAGGRWWTLHPGARGELRLSHVLHRDRRRVARAERYVRHATATAPDGEVVDVAHARDAGPRTAAVLRGDPHGAIRHGAAREVHRDVARPGRAHRQGDGRRAVAGGPGAVYGQVVNTGRHRAAHVHGERGARTGWCRGTE